jgi:phosphate:Na+ symporter
MLDLFSVPLTSLGEALGGLGLFILGMKTMSEGLQRFAGDRFRRSIERLAGNRLSAAFLGSCLAALLQSSSSAAIIVVGFVNAGLISLYQALGVLLGTGVGATLAVQFIAFQITTIAFPTIFVGVILKFFGNRRKVVYIGELLLGTGLVFLGLKLMEVGFTPISQSAIIQAFNRYVLSWRLTAVLLGAFITFLVQSSSTATGIVIALAGSGFVTIADGVAMVVGENLGIALITLVATLNGTLAAKRTALVNLLIHVCAVTLTLMLFRFFLHAVQLFSPGDMNLGTQLLEAAGQKVLPRTDLARQIANAHTLFNLFVLVFFLPLIGFFARSAATILPSKDGSGDLSPQTQFIDLRVINTPTIAMLQVRNEIQRMADLASSMFADVVAQFYRFDAKRLATIRQKEEVLDVLQKEISSFLVQLSRRSLDAEYSLEIPIKLQLVNSLEHVGDGSWALMNYLLRKKEEKVQFSSTAMTELKQLASQVTKIVELAVQSISSPAANDLPNARQQKDLLLQLQDAMLAGHVRRMKYGNCSIEAGLLYSEMITSQMKIVEYAYAIVRAGRELQ